MRVLLILAGALWAGGAAYAQSSAPAEPGKTETTTACTACHEAATYSARHLTSDQWAEMVDQMVGKGAKVSDADYDKIVAYLARTYGPVAGK